MSIQDKIVAAASAITASAASIKASLARKRATAVTADETVRFGNRNYPEAMDYIKTNITAHINGPGSEHINLDNIEVYDKAYTNIRLSENIRTEGMPVSRYGDLGFLPAGVASYFEGASTDFTHRNFILNMEDDGTLLYLRNATNGSRLGVFYAYVKHALTGLLVEPIRTNHRYQPAFFPANETAQYIVRTDGKCVAGALQDAGGVVSRYFVSITNGTLNDAEHLGCFIDAANWPVDMYQYTSVFVGLSNVYIIAPRVNMFTIDQPITPFDICIWQIPMADAISGGTIVPSRLSNWTTNGFSGPIAAPDIRVAKVCIARTAAEGPILVSNYEEFAFNHMLFMLMDGAQEVDGTLRLRVMSDNYFFSLTNGNYVRPWYVFSMTCNINSRQVSLDPECTTPNYIVQHPDGTVTTGGSIVVPKNRVVPSPAVNTYDSLYYHADGTVLAVNDDNLPDHANYIFRGHAEVPNRTRYTTIRANSFLTGDHYNNEFYPIYGSAVGGALCGSYQLPGGRVLIYCSGRKRDGSSSAGLVIAQRGTDNYTYASINNGSYPGFSPHGYREFISDLGFNPMDYGALSSEIAANGQVQTFGSVFSEGLKNSGFLTCDSNLNSSGSVSFNPALYPVIVAAMFASIGYAHSAKDSRVMVVVPQTVAINPFAIVHWLDETNREHGAFLELAITDGSRTGYINNVSVLAVSSDHLGPEFSVRFYNDERQFMISGGVTIYEGEDAYFIGGMTKALVLRLGSAGGIAWRFPVPKATMRPVFSKAVTYFDPLSYEGFYPSALPGYGFGILEQLITTSDNYTKMLFVPYCTNMAGYDTWVQQPRSTWRVQISQDVAQGWLLYFTEFTPIIINGRYFNMIPITKNLAEITGDPSFKTFYVYAKYINGTAQYDITLNKQTESATVMYLGFVTTGVTSVTGITIDKVTRVNNYRLSASAKGSAIPVTDGLPSSPAHLGWE